MNTFTYRVPEELDDVRVDKCLMLLMESLSRSYIQKLIKDGQVLAEQETIKASYKVKAEEILTISVPQAIEPDIAPENIPLDILYEDEDVLVVNKPKGMVVHPAAGHASGTLVNALMYYCKGSLSGINGIMRPGIVHRIDKDTTGSVIVCKNDAAHISIAKQLKEHTVIRKYRAIVRGVIKEETGCVDAPVGRHPVNRKEMAVNYQNGKRAVTHYRVLKRFSDCTYVECELETGRTHQIRVHMASIGHSLVGDEIYGKGKKDKWKDLQGQVLHAMILGFQHPKNGKYIETIAPLPEYFTCMLNKME